LSRRDLVKLGASLPVALGIAGYASPSPVARAATTENGSPIAKRLPPEWLVNFGSNAEMRRDAVAALGFITPNERFFVRDHTGTPLGDNRELSRIRAWMSRFLPRGGTGLGLTAADLLPSLRLVLLVGRRASPHTAPLRHRGAPHRRL